MAKLVATRASCLSDFTLIDTSPSPDGPSVIFLCEGINVKKPYVHVRSSRHTPHDCCSATPQTQRKYGQGVTYRNLSITETSFLNWVFRTQEGFDVLHTLIPRWRRCV